MTTRLLTPNTATDLSLADDLAHDLLRVDGAETAYVFLPNGEQVTGFVVREERLSDGSTVNNVHLLTAADWRGVAREASKPVIRPVDGEYGKGKTARIHGLAAFEIAGRLGFGPNNQDDPGKVVNSWGFEVDGVRCAVWDWRGSYLHLEFSAWGPIEALRAVFGEHVSEGAWA